MPTARSAKPPRPRPTRSTSGDTRLDFLKKAGLAGGAVMGGGALLAALSPAAAMAKGGKGRPPAKFGKGDIGILNYALTLEYLEAAFYNETTSYQNKHHFIKNEKTQAFLKRTTADENAHVAFLKKALGSKAVGEAEVRFRRHDPQTRRNSSSTRSPSRTPVSTPTRAGAEHRHPGLRLGGALDHRGGGASRLGRRADPRIASTKGISPDGAFDTRCTAGQVLKAVEGLGVLK